MSTKGLLTLSQEGDVCPVCIDIFDEPVQLRCKHDFCLECAQMLKTVREAKGKKEAVIECPMCREETVLDINDLELSALTRNLTLKDSAERRRQLQPAEPELDISALSGKTAKVIVPRNIKLLEEYDAAIGKDGKTFIPEIHTGMLGYGVDDVREAQNPDFAHLTYWHGMIIGPQESPIGQLIYTIEIIVPEEYPKVPPEVNFIAPKVGGMPCVDDQGRVNVNLIDKVDMSNLNAEGMVEGSTGQKFKWDPSLNIADVLVAIRENMHMRSVCTPSSSLGHTNYK